MATDEQRISRLEGAYEQVDARLADISNRMDSMNARMDSMSSRMDSMEARFDARFNTQLILTVGSWVTLMAAIIAVLFT